MVSEALAGTRPRGSTSEADAELLQDLINSKKDRAENIITGNFIEEAFQSLRNEGLLLENDGNIDNNLKYGTQKKGDDGAFFVRRLRHLQHICQSLSGKMKDSRMTVGKNTMSNTSIDFNLKEVTSNLT